MIPTRTEFEAMLQRLREEQTESPTIDGKEALSLQTEGDRAYFIRHVAALANNIEPSYLIIGVEDGTWNPIGLDEQSPLRNADDAQQRMNQALANRLDPNLFVRYRTYEVDGIVYGLVALQGTRAPYIVAIEDREYGGNRTQAAPSWIYRGSFYIRRGANSVIANRQSEILGIASRVQELTTRDDQPDEFLTAYNYIDVEAEDFGRHLQINDLVEMHRRSDKTGYELPPAESWVSFVFCPDDAGFQIDTVGLKNSLKPDQRIGRGPEWYRGIPKPFIDMLYRPQATPREFLGKWSPENRNAGEKVTHFIRIRPSGHIEIVCTYPLVFGRDGVRCFSFVCLIGYLWQMIYLSQAIYQNSDYYGMVSVLVNLVGTKDTLLVEYARSPRGGWASPFSFEYTAPPPVCQDPNVQVGRRLALADSPEDEVEVIVREIGRDLGAYYGQDRPRCFDYQTGEFPARQYVNECRS